MSTLHFATNNDHKLSELRSILKDVDVLGLKDLGIYEDIPETGKTLVENALLKAKYLYNLRGGIALSEDTGLQVNALDGAPGVHTARYAGDERSADKNNNLLLKNLNGKSDRSARFVTIIAWVDSEGENVFEGVVNGRIALQPSGGGGFGYDPIFIPDRHEQTFAELPNEVKNTISHRARAVNNLLDWMRSKELL
jgi:XTP/dITP diphosphohydrolase